MNRRKFMCSIGITGIVAKLIPMKADGADSKFIDNIMSIPSGPAVRIEKMSNDYTLQYGPREHTKMYGAHATCDKCCQKLTIMIPTGWAQVQFFPDSSWSLVRCDCGTRKDHPYSGALPTWSGVPEA